MIEYKIIELGKSKDMIEDEFNSLSRKGWRIVCSCGKHDRHIILRRKVREIEEEDE